jgi:hypothetical protein
MSTQVMKMYRSVAICPVILIHLMMAKWAETCRAIDILFKNMQLETVERFKMLKLVV